jgi:transcriptional regulator with XRE-family HTH domain
MIIGERLRELREANKFSQGEIEKRTGCLRCYTSRVENGHTVPSVETLEKYARALEVPMYKLFIENNEKPNLPQTEFAEATWGKNEKERRELRRFAKALSRMDDQQRKLLLAMAQRMVPRRKATATQA